MKRFLGIVLLFLGSLVFGGPARAAVTVYMNGSAYSIPQKNERGWGDVVTSWIQATSSGTLQKSGGAFTLTADADFGSSYGLKSAYFSTRSSNPSGAGLFRLANAESIGWRNAANSGNLLLTVNSSNQLTFNGNPLFPSTALTGERVVSTTSAGLLTTLSGASGALVTDASSVPSLATSSADGEILRRASGTVGFGSIDLADTDAVGSSILPVANGGTGLSTTPSNGFLPIGNGTNYTLAGITGTTDQITVTNGAGSITLSTPQNIATSSSPTFASVTATTSLLVEDPGAGTDKITLQAPTLSGAYALTLPTGTGSANQVLTTDGSGVLSWSDATAGLSANNSVSLAGAGSIAIGTSNAQKLQHWRVQGASGAVTLSSTPFGSSAPQDRSLICLTGTSDTNTVTIAVADSAKGFVGNGDVTLGQYESACFVYLSTDDRFALVSRSN